MPVFVLLGSEPIIMSVIPNRSSSDSTLSTRQASEFRNHFAGGLALTQECSGM